MKLNRILTLFMALGLFISGIVAYQRHQVESEYKTYEVDFYYTELEKLAQQEGKTIDEYLQLMKGVGITNMFIREETIQSMKQSANYDVETRISGYDLIIESPDEALIRWIFNGYNDVKKSDREVILEDANTIRVVGKSYEQIVAPTMTVGSYGQKGISATVWEGSMLETVGLGYDASAIEKAKKYGYGVILAPTYSVDFQDAEKSVARYFDTLDQYELSPSHIFFTGTRVVGYDPQNAPETGIVPFDTLAKGLEDRNIALGFIESASQGGYLETEGMKALAEKMEYEAAGNYLTWDFIQNKFDYKIPYHHNGEEITNIFFRGITTRNIRIVALKPFVVDNRYVADPSSYKKVLDDLQSRLRIHGIVPGTLQTMEYFEIGSFYKIMIASGIIAACLIVLDNLLAPKKSLLYALLLLGMLGTAGIYLALPGFGNLLSKIYALLGAMVMPTIALFVMMATVKQHYETKTPETRFKSMLSAIGSVIVLLCVCFGGALFEIAMLAHSKYLMGLDAFSGVKFSQMIPMLMTPVVYMAYYGYKRGYRTREVSLDMGDVKGFLTDSIKIWQVMLLGLAAGVLLIFMLRSGNTSGEPSMVEALLRNALEYIFPARPRTKAIFVGIPALLILFYHANRHRFEKGLWVFAFAGSIALVNTVNTFSHMKAPIYLSVYRTGAELLVGVLVGLLFILCEEVITKFISNRKNKGKEKIHA